MGDAGGERDDLTIHEHGREDEHVLQVLSALERVVLDEEVAGFQCLRRMQFQARLAGRGDAAQLHRDQVGLGDDVALTVQDRG